MQGDVSAEARDWIRANGKGATEMSFVAGKSNKATVDVNGYGACWWRAWRGGGRGAEGRRRNLFALAFCERRRRLTQVVELTVVHDSGNWMFELDEDEDDEGMARLSTHMLVSRSFLFPASCVCASHAWC